MNIKNPWRRLLPVIMLVALALAGQVSAQNLDNRQEISPFSQAELAQMLAPIALYPDSLLTHILIASTYPLELVEAQRWRNKHQRLDAAQAVQQAQDKDWDPSVIALLAFPNVLAKLSDDLSWTQSLGDAFLQDDTALLASIQTLRQQADEADSLSKMENMTISRVNNQIIIEPVQTRIVYVPYYDPNIVYGRWRWHSYPPIYWSPWPNYVRRPHGNFYWNVGVTISFNYFFSEFHWHKRHIVVSHHRHSNYYRPRGKISTSHGAQRWQHKPHHRKGVAYRSAHIKQRYNSHRPSQLQPKHKGIAQRYRISPGRYRASPERNSISPERNGISHSNGLNNKHNAKPKHVYNKQVNQQRERKFSNKLRNSADKHTYQSRPTRLSQQPQVRARIDHNGQHAKSSNNRQINQVAPHKSQVKHQYRQQPTHKNSYQDSRQSGQQNRQVSKPNRQAQHARSQSGGHTKIKARD